MKWFKHYCNAHKGQTLQYLSKEFGKAKGYGLFFLFTSYFADKWDGVSEPEFTVATKELAAFLGIKSPKLISLLRIMQDSCITFSEETKDILKINFPKLLEIRDEYALKSGRKPDKIRSRSGLEQKKKKSNKLPPRAAVAKGDESPPPATSPTRRVLDFYREKWAAKYGELPHISWAKDSANLKRLCEEFGEEKVKACIEQFLRSTEPFHANSGHSLAVFVSSFNQLLAAAAKKRPVGLEGEWYR